MPVRHFFNPSSVPISGNRSSPTIGRRHIQPPPEWFTGFGGSTNAATFMWHALAKDTRPVYNSAVKSCIEFCTAANLPQPFFPARTIAVVKWLTFMGSDTDTRPHRDYRTAQKYRFALRSHHIDLGLPYDGVMNDSTARIIDGIRNYYSGNVCSAPPAPLRLPLLRQAVLQVRKNRPAFGGERDSRALIAGWLVLWAGWMRCRELAFSKWYKRWPSRADYDLDKDILHLPWTKTSRWEGVDIPMPRNIPRDVCPIHAIHSLVYRYPSDDAVNTLFICLLSHEGVS